MILSQAKTPDGIIQPWANTPVGFSKNLMHAKGSAVVLLAEIMELSPLEVNEKLKSVEGFIEDQIIWEKIVPAFSGWAAQYIEPYDNKAVLDALANGQFVIVITDTNHAIRYMGDHLCHDPKDGTEKPTLTYSNVRACVILTHIPDKIEVPKPTIEENKLVVPVIESYSAATATNPNAPKQAILKQLKKIKAAEKEIKKLLGV